MADFTIRPVMSSCNCGGVKRTQTAGMKPTRSGGSVKINIRNAKPVLREAEKGELFLRPIDFHFEQGGGEGLAVGVQVQGGGDAAFAGSVEDEVEAL